jgi:RecB family exonuclease
MGLPPHPTTLRIHPSRMSADAASLVAAPAGKAAAAVPTRATTLEAEVTFDALVEALGSVPGWRFVDAVLGRLLVRHLLKAQGGRLGRAADDAYGIRAVHRALLELRQAGVLANQLGPAGASEALQELAALLGAYESALDDRRWFDAADRARQAVLAVIQSELPSSLKKLEAVELVGGTELFGPRLDLLSAFAARGMTVSLRLPYDAERPQAFAWTEAMLHAVESRGHARLKVTYDARLGAGPLQPLRAAQFTDQVAKGVPARAWQVAEGPEHVAQLVAQVAAWIDAGVPTHRMGVVVAGDTVLETRLVEALERIGVPAYGRRGPPLLPTAPARCLLAALRLPALGYPREPLLELWAALAPHPAGPARVAQGLRRAGIKRVPPGSAAKRFAAHPTEAGADDVPSLEALLARLQALPAEGTLASLCEALLPLCDAMALRPLASDAAPAAGRPEHEAAHAAVRELLVAVQQASRALPEGATWSRDELADALEAFLAERRLPPRGTRSGAVRILSPQEAVGLRFSRVILAGANAGVFPRAEVPDPVLTDTLRAEINKRVGPRLVQYAPLLGRGALPAEARDTWLWMELLACAQDELLVTVTAAPGEEEVGQSELVDELLRSADMQLVGPPPSYTAPAQASVEGFLQAWATATPSHGVAQDTVAQLWPAIDAGLRRYAAPRLARLEARLAAERQHVAGHPGALGPEERAALEAHFFATVHSTSRLDLLGMCRYRHFASAILRLREEDVPSLGANPREQGSAAHAALHLVYRDIMARGGLRQARLDPGGARERAREVFWEHAEAILAEVAVHPLLRDATLMHAWRAVAVQLDRDLKVTTGEPIALEYRFDDREGADAPELRLEDPRTGRTLRVRGSIDRIDLVGNALETLDYKRTISVRSPERHFQLGLYGAVALRDLRPAIDSVGAAWLDLWRGTRKIADELCGSPSDVLSHVSEALWRRIDPVLAGDISPDPDDPELCERCDYRALCRFRGRSPGGDP